MAPERPMDLLSTLQAVGSIFEDGLLAVDAEGIVVFCNQTALDMLPGAPDESDIVGRKFDQCLDLKELVALIHEILYSGRSASVLCREVTYPSTEREREPFWARAARVLNRDGQTLGAAVIMGEASRARRMLAVASHEMKAPLAAIVGYLEMLLSGPEAVQGHEQRQILERCRDRALTLMKTTANLLDISKAYLGEGRAPEDMQEVDLMSVLDEIKEVFAKEAEKAGVEIVLEALPGIPRVIANREDMWHLFSNLVSNAVKYNVPGGRVTINASRTIRGQVRVRVSDTGVGIEARHLPFIFDEFYRIRRTPPVGAGNDARTEGAAREDAARRMRSIGLGLALVKRIVQSYGGSIDVESEPGKGTAFTVYLPIHEPATQLKRPSFSMAEDRTPAASRATARGS